MSRRFHIWVPKAIVPLSTRRNRLKRLLREALRAQPELVPPGEGVYVIKVTRFPGPIRAAEAGAQLRKVLCR